MAHSGVFYIFERRRDPQTLRGLDNLFFIFLSTALNAPNDLQTTHKVKCSLLSSWTWYILAVSLSVFGIISAVVETSLEQLDGDDGEYELEERVDHHNVEHVLERVDDTVEHRLHTTGTSVIW